MSMPIKVNGTIVIEQISIFLGETILTILTDVFLQESRSENSLPKPELLKIKYQSYRIKLCNLKGYIINSFNSHR